MTASEPVSRFISAPDGLRLHLRDYGPRDSLATPVVCLPGLARTADDFDVLARALAQGRAGAPRRVVAIDYRGRGLSDRDPDWTHYDLFTENADILAMLTAVEIGAAIFVGTSRGGMHTMLTTATRPTAIRAAVLNDIGPELEAKGLARIRGYVGKLPAPKSWADAVDLARHVMGAQFPGLSEDDWNAYARLTFEEKNGAFSPRYDTRLTKGLEQIDFSKPLPTMWPQFEGLAGRPVLVIRGEHSDLLSPDMFEAMQRRLPRCEGYTVAGQGHAPLLRDEASIARIADFIVRAEA